MFVRQLPSCVAVLNFLATMQSGGVHPDRRHSNMKTEKKRKRTHAQRKEVFSEEIRLLESAVAVLETRGLSQEQALLRDSLLLPSFESRAGLLYALHAQQLRVAKMQSALSRCLIDQHFYPLYSKIHLSKDWHQRRTTLLAIREQKLRSALDFVMAQSGNDDPSTPQFSEHKFETDEGDLCCVRYETVHFPGVASLQQVFEALWFFLTNMEIVISEQLGQITLRDDYDTADGRAINTRFISTNHSSGIITEGNVVTYRRIFDESEDEWGGETCAVVAVDSVDEDELHPYISDQRARRDASGAVVLTAKRMSTNDNETRTSGDPEDELVVTMRRATFWKFYHPQFPLPEVAVQEFHEGMMEWADVMVKSLRGILYAAS